MGPMRLFFLLAVLSLPTAALGQTPADPFLQSFNAGTTLLGEGRFAEALEHLERARSLNATPAVDFNLAFAQRGLGRLVAATVSLERCLARGGERIDAVRRAEIERMLAELRSSVARVTVHVTVTGAAVTVDGQAVAGEQLDRELPMDPGSHVVRATGERFDPIEATRSFARGEHARVELSPTLRVTTGTLRIEPSVATAEVFVDQRRVGQGLFTAALTPGRHAVEVRAPGYLTFRADALLTAGSTERVGATLTRQERGILTRWWFWTAVGVVAVGATAAIIVGTSGTEDPVPGSLGTVQAQVLR